MNTRAAVLRGMAEPWQVLEIEIDPPISLEVEVEMTFAGLCHSDEHMRDGVANLPPNILEAMGLESVFPLVGGHEGAGVVARVGSEVRSLREGDHVAVCMVPACGTCWWCASGRQQLCDRNATTLAGPMVSDGTYRYRLDGRPLNRMAQLGTFAPQMVCHEASLIKIDPDVSLRAAAIVSCGVATGFGASANRGGVSAGESVVVIGCGGLGSGAILGATHSGASVVVAVDPVPFKRDSALKLGATHAANSVEEAFELVAALTHGRLADVAVLTPGILHGELIQPALSLVSKDGRLVCVGAAPWDQRIVSLDLFNMAMYNKAILGCMFGSQSPRTAIPRLLDMYRRGQLDLDQLVTREYPLEGVQQGYEDMLAGRNIRGVVNLKAA